MGEQALYENLNCSGKPVILDGSIAKKHNVSLENLNPTIKKVIGTFESMDWNLAGSGDFNNIHLQNSGALPKNIARLATRQDLERVIAQGGIKELLGNSYTDCGIAILTPGDTYDPNNASAENLANQLMRKGIKIGSGLLIPTSALRLQETPNSRYGLMLDLREGIIDLNTEQIKEIITDFKSYKWDCTRREGVSSAYLTYDKKWDSSTNNLGSPSGFGKVVGIRKVK